jgi:hypothetical protein
MEKLTSPLNEQNVALDSFIVYLESLVVYTEL